MKQFLILFEIFNFYLKSKVNLEFFKHRKFHQMESSIDEIAVNQFFFLKSRYFCLSILQWANDISNYTFQLFNYINTQCWKNFSDAYKLHILKTLQKPDFSNKNAHLIVLIIKIQARVCTTHLLCSYYILISFRYTNLILFEF